MKKKFNEGFTLVELVIIMECWLQLQSQDLEAVLTHLS